MPRTETHPGIYPEATPTHHRKVNVAGVKFHVDLLVNGGFTILMVVLADLAGHLDRLLDARKVTWGE